MVTGVILAKGRPKTLFKLLNQLSFCKEVIVVDNGLEEEIRANLKKRDYCKIVKFKSEDFSAMRNYALQLAKTDWVFFIDSDERLEDSLRKEILEVVKDDSKVAYYISRREFFLGKEIKYGEVLKARVKGIIRLVKKEGGKWEGKVHEVFVPNGKAGKLKSSLLHFSHNSVADFIKKINYYSTLRAKELFSRNKKVSLFEIIFIPLLKFFYTYFVLLGFLDGYRGFVYSFLMSFHSFLVRAKLYQYWTVKK